MLYKQMLSQLAVPWGVWASLCANTCRPKLAVASLVSWYFKKIIVAPVTFPAFGRWGGTCWKHLCIIFLPLVLEKFHLLFILRCLHTSFVCIHYTTLSLICRFIISHNVLPGAPAPWSLTASLRGVQIVTVAKNCCSLLAAKDIHYPAPVVSDPGGVPFTLKLTFVWFLSDLLPDQGREAESFNSDRPF